jgi:hypothetical protein
VTEDVVLRWRFLAGVSTVALQPKLTLHRPSCVLSARRSSS